MTKIKILGDRIIFDGHADTQRECETVTLMCDNLAKSVDFKTIKYENGYAEFEKIGGIKSVKDLMFPPALTEDRNIILVWDNGITSVTAVPSITGGSYTWTSSNTSQTVTAQFGDYESITYTPVLKDGYIIDTVSTNNPYTVGDTVSIAEDKKSVAVVVSDPEYSTITITTKQATAKQTIDVSTLSGWESLASGDHSITVKTKASGYLDSASSNVVSVTKVVTPTNTLGNLAIGSKLKISHSVLGDIIFLKADKDHDGYPSNSTTLITEKIILLRCFDAKEPNNSDSSRKSYGNNKYSVSNLDQWLNSSAAAGQWYSARHSADQAPDNANVYNNYNEYDQDAGFLAGFDAAFVAALKDTTLKVALNTATDGGGYESIIRKFFLPSRAEIFGTAENNIMEGSLLSYFSAKTTAIRIAQISAYAAAHSEYSVTAGNNWYYWVRTPESPLSAALRGVGSDGTLDYNSAYYSQVGVRPLCNLDSGISVSDSTDSDGCYTLSL